MLHIYSNLEISKNLSVNPSGLIKWIIEVLSEEKIDFKLYRESKSINKLRNAKILIYPSHLKKKLENDTKNKNKIISIGPDCNTLEILTLLKFRLSIFHKILPIKLLKNILIYFFDKENISDNKTLVVVGEEDFNILKKYNRNTFFMEHPYLSSIPNEMPIIAKFDKKLDVVIIGKLKGMPVGFSDITNIIEKHLFPILERNNIFLYLFKTSGIRLTQKIVSNKRVRIITKEFKLNKNFFQKKVVINLTVCGGGTANRSLSALYDGAYLFSNKFGIRNINIEMFDIQIGSTNYSPFEKNFYIELENFLNTRKNIDNTNNIININKNTKSKLINLINNV